MSGDIDDSFTGAEKRCHARKLTLVATGPVRQDINLF